MNDMSEVSDAIADDLWQRFRLLTMVIDRTDSFVGMTPAGADVSGEQTPSRWLNALANNLDEVKAIAGDLVSRTLRTALEPENFAILQKLREQPAVPFSELMPATQLNRLSLSERINDLVQAGLAVKDVQTSQVQGTRAAAVIVDFVQQVRDTLSNRIMQKFSDLRYDS